MNIPRSLLALIPFVLFSNLGCGGGSATPSAPTPASPATATVTVSAAGGVQAASSIIFSVQAANFEAGALTYRWEFGDGETSADAAPAHVFNSAGTYNVAVTVSNARQSVRSQTSVTIYGLTGQWTSSGGITMELAQSGSSITGQASYQNGPGEAPYTQCVITGSVAGAPGTPAAINLTQPPCAHPVFPRLVPFEFRLNMAVGGQTIFGTFSSPSVADSTRQIALNR